MADLSDLQAAQTVKIVGTDATGVESNPVNADTNGNIKAIDYATSATGSAVPSNASLIGGRNPSGNLSAIQVDANGYQMMVGNIAAGSADSGNPLKIGGIFNTTLPTVTNGQRVDFQATAKGSQHVNLRNGSDGTEMIGQKTMVASIPVVLPSDQTLTVTSSPLPATGSKFSFGQVTTSATTQVPVNSTTYTEQTTNGQRSIASANANDTAAGTGARTVQITYYDQTGAGPFTENLTLNGTTGVNTVSTTICFIENIKVLTVGSTGSNVGIISLYTAINKGGSVFGTIAATANQTFWTHHYVPSGKTSFISGFSGGTSGTSSSQNGNFVLKATTPTIANSAEIQVSDNVIATGAGNSVARVYNSPIQIVGPARVRALVTPGATSTYTTFASFDYIDN